MTTSLHRASIHACRTLPGIILLATLTLASPSASAGGQPLPPPPAPPASTSPTAAATAGAVADSPAIPAPSAKAPEPKVPPAPAATPASPDQPITDPVIAALALAPRSPQGVPLSIEECVQRALASNFNLRIQRYTTESVRENLPIAESTFSPQLTASTAYGEARNTSSSTGNSTKNNGNDTRLAVSQKISTGATASLSGSLNRNHTNPWPTSTNSRYNSIYNSDVALSISQPLLKGAGREVNLAGINRARLGNDIAELDFTGAVLAVVRDVESAYYNLLYARGLLGVREFSLKVAERLLDENKSRLEAGVGTELEVLQAEVTLANSRRDILDAEQIVSNREDTLVALFGDQPGGMEVGALTLPDAAIPEVTIDRSYKLALDNFPEYRAILLSIRQARLDVTTAASNKRPGLALGGALGYNADDDSYTDAARRTFNGDRYDWQVDLTLTFPWGMKAERAQYRQSVLALTREQTRLNQLEQNLRVQVRAAVRAVDTNRESVRIATLATKLSERQYEFEKARYDSGLTTFRRVQESQEDLDTARVNELQSRINLRLALCELSRLEASSLSRYNIAVIEPATNGNGRNGK
ncbi:TolC family protein [Geminisphaera colitermitum]|uniref:TolC family protein n=1 Tax=Geminisphaera colitermitum TaxID=1148786 RepID=UPI00019651B9|nr:TolC family protein [Geminisphaera colitermitum]